MARWHLEPSRLTRPRVCRRFVTTSDDKCIRVWDFGIPFSIKYIADPSMQSMPYVSKRPDDKYVLMQSLVRRGTSRARAAPCQPLAHRLWTVHGAAQRSLRWRSCRATR